jgi:hypothetical protein
MSVKVTLEFKSADEAIVALGKLVGIKTSAAPAAVAAGPQGAESPAVVPAAAEPRTRKARADKGQPRGPYKITGEPAEMVQKDGTDKAAASAPAKSAPPAAPTQTPGPTGTATLAEVQAALNELYEKNGHDVSLAVLSRFGVDRAKNLLPEAWADFIAKARAVIAGEAP